VLVALDLPAPALGGYEIAEIDFARDAWPLKAAEELRSALIFRALARAAATWPIGRDWAPRFLAAAREEISHAKLCATIGARLGAPRPRYDARPVHARLCALTTPARRACALALIEVAVGETLSVAMFRAGRRAAREPLTRAALERIVADEIGHQRLGWAAMSAWWPELDTPSRAALQEDVRAGLGAMEQTIAAPALRWLQSGVGFNPKYAELGVLAPEARVEAFYAAVERLVVPRLTRLGLDGPRAWQDRYKPAESAR